MATFPYDPLTMQALMESMPDIQRKKRRAEELRRQNQQFKEMGAKRATGTMLPTQHGGLYQTVAQYQPDVAGMANQGIGAIGDWMTGRQAEEAQSGYDQAQTEALLGMSQQMGNQPMGESGAGAGLDAAAQQEAYRNAAPTEETLRLAMGMIGGPELKDFLPKSKADLRTQSTHKLANGNLGIITNDPSNPVIDTGVPYDYNVEVKLNELTGKYETIGKSGAGRGLQAPTRMAGQEPQQPQQPQQPSQPQVGAIPAIQNVLRREGGYVPDDAGRGPTNYGINQEANPEYDVSSLTPDQAAEIYKQKYWDAIDADNLPPAIQEAAFDAAVNMGQQTAIELAAESGGDPIKFRQLREARYDQIYDQSRHTPAMRAAWTRRNNETTGGGTAATGTAVSTTGNVPATDPNAPQPGQMALTPQQQTDLALSKEERAAETKRISEAKDSYSKVTGMVDETIADIDSLIDDPDLKHIVKGSPAGTFTDEAIENAPLGVNPFSLRGAKGGEAFTKYKKISGSAFLKGYQDALKGSGPVATEEAKRAAAAASRLTRGNLTPEQFRNALIEYRTSLENTKERARQSTITRFAPTGPADFTGVTSKASTTRNSAKPRPKLPPGFSYED